MQAGMIDLVPGGGREHSRPAEVTGEEGDPGARTDGRNLVEEATAAGVRLAQDQTSFDALDPAADTSVLDLFEAGYMQYDHDRTNEPSIAEMTAFTIDALSRERGGLLPVHRGRLRRPCQPRGKPLPRRDRRRRLRRGGAERHELDRPDRPADHRDCSFALQNGEETWTPLPGVTVDAGDELHPEPQVLALRLSGLKQPLEDGVLLDSILASDDMTLPVEVAVEPEGATAQEIGAARLPWPKQRQALRGRGGWDAAGRLGRALITHGHTPVAKHSLLTLAAIPARAVLAISHGQINFDLGSDRAGMAVALDVNGGRYRMRLTCEA